MGTKTSQGDAELLAEARYGSTEAYGWLYERHAPAARILARCLLRSATEVEEVVAETFSRILALVRHGDGPTEAFRPYLLTMLRRTVHDWTQGEGGQAVAGETEVPFVDPALTGLERSPVVRAFLSLPERWQLVLWHTGVEGARPAAVAPLLGLTTNGVVALAYMAREGWRQAYLRIHLEGLPRRGCLPVLDKMAAYARGGLTREDGQDLDEHMDGCADCHNAFLELVDANQELRVIVGPLIAGPALTGYLAGLDRAATAGTGGLFNWWRQAPQPRRQALVTGAAVGAVVLAAALVLITAQEMPATPAAPTAPSVPSAPTAPAAPAAPSVPSAPSRPSAPTTSTAPARSSRPSAPTVPTVQGASDPGAAPIAAALDPSSQDPPSPYAEPGRPHRPQTVAPILRQRQSPVPAPRLIARIAALGALVRSEAGIVAVRLRNAGDGESGELVADVDLPDGVTVPAAAHRGWAVAEVKPVGTVDGWACRAGTGGARCSRRPLAAGRATAIFLRVLVSPTAAEGAAPSVRVSSAGGGVTARSRTGVRAVGAPARFATDGQVITAAIGNTLLDCGSTDPACQAARAREGDRRDNDLWEMSPLDQDRDASTRSSSAARLTLPRTSKVVWAGLYWSASAPADGLIRFKAPGDQEYRQVKAERVVERELPVGVGYQAFADVTRLMSTLHGTYWAADASLTPGLSRHAGWSLVVIAADPHQPYSHAVVVDTVTVVDRERGPAWIPLDGLTPTAAPARIHLVTWEGDAAERGDQVTLGGHPLRPSGGDRDAGNPFDGSAAGAEGMGMTFGTDVDDFQAALGRDPVLKVSTDQDVLLFGVAAVRVVARL
ncbi:DNA-directed RNA polymerase specialized sigma24 family protein [Streptosporangium album]|uniref:DNA-directed RNA polymerase specialized sigma24 family protein n=1 Tax=Streptosporangium album TaxID=47479 RepID=A0A7W7RV45_9ACTN|nr:sigma-70 family RNA polymerase sigma factor [Streptosporangium album]MBB4938794.1 DNA-directed RNA polymerase specialized sigma24 family protein [Streptosporangium album]